MITSLKILGNDDTNEINTALNIHSCDRAELLAGWIIKNYEEKLVKNIIDERYSADSYFDYDEVFDMTMEHVRTFTGSNLELIKNQLKHLLEQSSFINIDGFIRFRLQDYCKFLEEVIDECIEDYYTKREYDDFIDLIKEFMQTENSAIETLHIVVRENGGYNFFDNEFYDITTEIINIYFDDFFEEFNSDDMMLSSLIILSPEHVVIHNPNIMKNRDLLKTVEKIFENKLEFCNGACFLCSR